jgi:AraC-like DNA-binding protein
MILEILPSSLYGLPNIEVILKNNTSSIIFKSLSESLEKKKMYLSSVAILLVMKGEQVIQSYEKTDFIVKENEIVILPKGLYVVSDFVTKQDNFEAFIFFIDDQLIKKFLLVNSTKQDKNKIKSTILKIKISHQIDQYIQSLSQLYKKAKKINALLEIKVLEFLLLLELQENSQPLISSLINPIKKRNISEFMEENYLSNLKISDYAILTGRSESSFNRDFKRLFGTTPKKWLITKRLSKSHELLSNAELNVTQAAMEVGYENVSHFIDAYKKAYGVTPKSTLTKKND